jgi:hypothetical protein
MIEAYLIIHGVITVGAIITFLVKNEHRITKLEVDHKHLKGSHDTLTHHGTIPHAE